MTYFDRRNFIAGLCVVGAASTRAAAAPGGQTLTITGASTLAPLIQEVAQRYSAANGGLRVDVQSGGTYRGIADVRRNIADVGMVSRALNPNEKDIGETLIGRDGVAMIIHKSNGVTSLDNDQVKAIYRGEITNWKQVGGSDGTITVVNKAEGRSTLDVFVGTTGLGVREIKAQVIIGDNEQGIKVVAGNPRAIAYVSIGTAEYQINAGSPLRMLGFGATPPSVANVANGSYLATRDLNLVHARAPSPKTAAFLAFATLEKNHDLVREYFFIPPAK